MSVQICTYDCSERSWEEVARNSHTSSKHDANVVLAGGDERNAIQKSHSGGIRRFNRACKSGDKYASPT